MATFIDVNFKMEHARMAQTWLMLESLKRQQAGMRLCVLDAIFKVSPSLKETMLFICH